MTTTQARPWLQDGVDVEGLKTTKEALESANLDFEVLKLPTFARAPNGVEIIEGESVPVFNEVVGPYFYTIREDTQAVLGCVGASYKVIQTREAMAFFDAAIGPDALCIDAVGQTHNGARLWLAAKVPDQIVIKGDDVIDRYILLTVGHDGHWGVNALFTGVRPSCINTVTAAIRNAGKTGKMILKVRHTTNASKNLKEALNVVAKESKYWQIAQGAFRRMAEVEVNHEDLDNFLANMFPAGKIEDEGTEKLNKQTKDRRAYVKWAFENAPGADLAGNTVYGAYNAYTYWLDNSARAVADKAFEGMPLEGARRVKGSAWESSNFASGAKLRQKAMDLALQMV